MKLRPMPIRTTLVGGIVFLIPVAVALSRHRLLDR